MPFATISYGWLWLSGDMKSKLTTEHVSKLLNVSQQTLLRWRQDGKGPPCTKVGRRWLYDQDEIQAWLSKQPSIKPGEDA